MFLNEDNSLTPIGKAAAWTLGGVAVTMIGAVVYNAMTAQPTPACPSPTVMPELPPNTPGPTKVFTVTENNTAAVVPSGSRIDVVLPDMRATGSTWTQTTSASPPTGSANPSAVYGGFDLFLKDSSQSSYSGVNSGGPIYIGSFMVGGGSSGTVVSVRYDLKDGSGNIQSTLQFTLTTQ
jgi:hypothetical protein